MEEAEDRREEEIAVCKREVRRTGGGISAAAPISSRMRHISGLINADELSPPLTTNFDCDTLAMACESTDIDVAVQQLSFVGDNNEADITILFYFNFQQQLQPSPQQSP